MAALGFPLGLLFVTAALCCFRLDAGLGFQTCFRCADLRQPVFASLQFVGQFVAATAAQGGVLLGVELLGLLQQLLDLGFQPLDGLVHVAVAHRLVPRGVGTHLRPVRGQIPQLDHPQRAGQTQHVEKERSKRRLMDLAKIADGAKVGRSLAHDGSKSQVAFASGRDLAAGADAHGISVHQERHHHRDVERRLATHLPSVILMESRQVQLWDQVQQEEHQVVFGQRFARRNQLLAAMLGVPRAVVLASIFHDLAPVFRLKTLESRETRIIAKSTEPVQIDR